MELLHKDTRHEALAPGGKQMVCLCSGLLLARNRVTKARLNSGVGCFEARLFGDHSVLLGDSRVCSKAGVAAGPD